MNKIINMRLILSICFMVTIGFMMSCKKDNEVNSGMVELLSFGPTGAKHGDTLRFIGNNLYKVTEIQLTGAAVAKNDFIQQTAEIILIIVPQAAEQGFVTLKTPEGDIVSKTQLNLNVPVKITSITGTARPGDNITITGEYLNWVTRVTFEKDKSVDTFVSKSLNQLVVKVPIDPQSGKILVFTGGTEPLEIFTDSSLKVTLPSFSSFSPNPVEREANLTITGNNLDLTKGILFKGKTEPDTVFVSKSATQLVIKVPKEANKGKIELVAYSGVKTESTEDLKLIGDLPPLADFPHAIYTDGLQNGFQDWSWAARDLNSTDNVRQGTKSIKATYGGGGYEGITFHNDNGPATGSYTQLEFSVFVPAALDGKKLNLVINGNWGSPYKNTLVGGEWRTFNLNLSAIGSPNPLKEVILQSDGWTGVIYIDHVGLR